MATAIGAGVSMAFSEGLSDSGELTGRGNPYLRGAITGAGTFAGGILHTLPFLIPQYHAALTAAVITVALELVALAWIRSRFFQTGFLRSVASVIARWRDHRHHQRGAGSGKLKAPDSDAATPALRRGRPRSEARKQAILQAAFELLGEHGLDATSMDAVADRAGVSKATIYRWWDSKELLALDALYAAWDTASQARARPARFAARCWRWCAPGCGWRRPGRPPAS